jgi:hypothetical protein
MLPRCGAPFLTARNRASRSWTPGCGCCAGPSVPCTVLDPFFGAATSGLIAAKDQRRCIGIELNACYLRLGHERMTTPHGRRRF